MRIAILLAGPWETNGVCRVAESWARILAAADHRVTLVCEEGGPNPELPECRVSTYPVARTANRFGRWWSRQESLLQTLVALDSEEPFDVHLSHDCLPTLGVRRVWPNARLAQTIHSPIVDENRLNNWRYASSMRDRALYPATLVMAWRMESQALRAVDRVHTLSEYTWRRLSSRHARLCNTTPWERIPGTFDDRRFVPAPNRDQARRDLGLPVEATILWTVRRLVPRNGVDRIVECARRLPDRTKEILFVIGGTGPEKDRIQAEIERLGVGDRVRLVGFVSEEELPAWYQAADAFLLPTRALECFGLPVIEAMACGCVPLIVPEGGPPELVRDPRFVASANTNVAFADLVERVVASELPLNGAPFANEARRLYSESSVAPAILEFVERLNRVRR
jgi:glycosyltransferase involved in cell wall biosynthesis